MIITKEYLQNNTKHIFVYGDNLTRKGKGGAAIFRDIPNTYGFLTKKYPNNLDASFYKPEEYESVFRMELRKLQRYIIDCPDTTWLISKLGSGLANKYSIYEKIIKPNIVILKKYNNVKFLYED